MKSRALSKIIGDIADGYDFHHNGDNIFVGGGALPKMIQLNKITHEITVRLSVYPKIEKKIIDKLKELIDSGEIKDIIEGYDEIPESDRMPVFYIEENRLVESYTDNFGYPNITFDGRKMYENTDFRTKKEALEYGISELGFCLKFIEEDKERVEDSLDKLDTKQDKALIDRAFLKHQLMTLK